jgi:signal transduction histidine kinase
MRLVPAGLRGRLLLALVATAAITLGATAAVVLGPLREKLRDQSVQNLQKTVLEAQPEFQTALRRDEPTLASAIGCTTPSAPCAKTQRELEDALALVSLESRNAATTLNERTDARVIVTGTLPVTFGPVYDTADTAATPSITEASERVHLTDTTVTSVDGDDVTIATPLFGVHGNVAGVLVVARRLTEVTTAVSQVRNALVVAALVGLAVAIALAIGLSRTLTRRLGRLRSAALRVTAEGPDAPAPPRDLARDEVGDLARALSRMQEELRRQEAARRSFVATASHELRTPLTMLQGTMELLEEDLREGGDLTDAQEQVASARRELLRLSALAGELLDLSRLDAEVQLRSEPVELNELVRAVIAEFGLRARERGVEILTEATEGPLWGRGDPDAVARVMRILLDNAMRYAPPGEPVRVCPLDAGDQVVIEVVDRGPGIPEEEREHVFERFHRGRSATSASGFGLGLAIGRELAERMGGRLDLADPDDGVGARFVLGLQAAGPAPGEPPRPAQRRVLT